jgi:alpha-mannosidase
VTWTTPDAPLVEPGAINAESPWMKSVTPGTKWYSYVMNNYWHTNYKADQEGPMEFRYSLYPHGVFNPLDAARLGRESRQPLIVCPAGNLKGRKFPLSLPSDKLILESIEPVNGGASWLVSIYNPSTSAAEFSLKWSGTRKYSLHASDLSGKAGSEIAGTVSVPAAATIILRIDPSSK